MSFTINGSRVPIRTWARPSEIEADAVKQLKAVAALPWVVHHVAVMPDVHVGKGATVGSVIALRSASGRRLRRPMTVTRMPASASASACDRKCDVKSSSSAFTSDSR